MNIVSVFQINIFNQFKSLKIMTTIISFLVAHSGVSSLIGGLLVNELFAWSQKLKPNSIGQFVFILIKTVADVIVEKSKNSNNQ